MTIKQTQFDGDFEISDTLKLNFGASTTETENYTAGSNVQRNTWGQGAASAFGSISDLVVPASLQGVFTELQGGDQVNNNFFMASMDELIAVLSTFTAYLQPTHCTTPMFTVMAATTAIVVTVYALPSPDNYDNFTEESTAAYLQVSYMGDIAGKPFNIRAGVRYEETEVVSSTEQQLRAHRMDCGERIYHHHR